MLKINRVSRKSWFTILGYGGEGSDPQTPPWIRHWAA
jgi:hypothetical protein